MDKKFLTFLMVISLQQFQVTLGQLNLEVTFTMDSIRTTTATVKWVDSASNFTDITYSINIEPSGPIFDTSSGDGSVFSSAGSTGISGLSPGAQYNFTVTFTKAGDTQDVAADSFNAAPEPPTGVTVTAVDTNTLAVSWTSDDTDNTQDSFKVYLDMDKANMATCSEGALTESSAICTFSVTGNAGAEHTVYVVSKSGGSDSETVQATGNTKPAAPTSLQVSNIDTTTVVITWEAGANSNQENFFYKLIQTSDNAEIHTDTLQNTTLSRHFTSVNPGKEYNFTVQAKNNGVFSEEIILTFTTKPKALKNVAVPISIGSTSITVTWDIDSASTQDNLIYTLVGASDTGVPTEVSYGSTLKTVDLATEAGETYNFTIYAVSNNVRSDGTRIEFTTKPLEPTITTSIAPTTTSATVTWTAAANSVEDTYVIELVGTGTTKGTLAPTDIQFRVRVFTDLASGYEYTVKIKAKSGSQESNEVTANFVTEPLPPMDVVVTGVDDNTVTVSWIPVTTHNKQDEFVVYLASDKGSVANCGILTGASTTCTFDVTGDAGASHTVYVVSKSEASESTTVMATGNTRPMPPTGVTVTAEDTNTIIVSWTPVAANNIQDTFVVYLASDKGSVANCNTLTGASTTCTFDVAGDAGASHTVYVVSKSGSSESTTVPATGNTAPKPPTSATVTAVDTNTLTVTVTPDDVNNMQDGVGVYLGSGTTNAVTCISNTSTSCTFDVTGHAGAPHTLYIVSKSGGSESTTLMSTGNTAPKPPKDVAVTAVDIMMLTVTVTPDTNNNVQNGVGVYFDAERTTAATCDPSTSTSCTFVVTGHPGASHTVYVVSKSGDSESTTVMATGNTQPPQIGEITVTTRNISQLILKAIKPDNSVIGNITVMTVPSSSSISSSYNSGNSYYDITIDSLIAGTDHSVTVTTVSGSEQGIPRTVIFSTIPAKPTGLTRKSATTSSMIVGWGPPEGNYDSFVISAHGNINSDILRTVLEYQISNLPTAGGAYPVTLFAKANGLQSDGVTITFRIKPNSPQNIQFNTVTATSFTVTWDAPTGEVTEYRYSIGSTDEGTNAKTHTFTGREPGTLFTVIIISKAEELASEPTTASVVTLPNPPRTLAIGITTTEEVTFTWTAPDQTADVTGYRYTIVVASNNTNIKDATTSEPSVAETGLYAGQTYDIKVWAYTDVGGHVSKESAESIDETVTMKPKPPTGLTEAEKTTTTLRVTWIEPSNTIYDRYKYKVYRSSDTNPQIDQANTGVTELSESNLEPGATYHVDVWTQVDDSDDNPVESEHEQIKVTMKPARPSTLTEVQKTRTTIEVQWNPPSSGIFDEYKLTVTDKSNNNAVLDGESLTKGTESKQLTGLSANRNYIFSLVTVSGSETSESIELDIKTESPSTPELISSEASSTSIDCKWTPGEGETVTKAILRLKDKDNGEVDFVTYSDGTSTHIFSGLQPGRYYTVEVVLTIDEADTTQTSSVVLSPIPVSNFMITKESARIVDLTWNIDTSSYQDEFVIDDGAQTYTVNSGSRTSQKIVNLLPGGWYEFTIHARVTHFSKSKTSIDVMKTVTTYPLVTTSFTAEANDHDSVTLTWLADAASNQTSYRIWFDSQPGTSTPSTREFNPDASKTSLVIDSFHPGAQYTFYIKTLSGETESENEDTDTVRTFPLAPETLTITTLTTQMTVSWATPGSIISDYRFEYTVTGITDWTDVDVDGNDTAKTINGLVPGQNYTVRMWGISSGIESQASTNKEATLVPQMTATITEDEESTRTNEVVINYSEEMEAGVFDKYIFSINGVSTPVHKAYSDTDRVVRFSELTPGTLYTVSARTHSGDQKSSVETLQVLTVPGKPTITCSEELSDEITVQIGRPNGGVTKYNVNCNGLNCETTRTPPESTDLLTYKPLIPFNSYTFDITAVVTLGNPSHTKTSSSDMVTCNTVESAPEEVASFDKDVVGYDVTLTWTEPTVKNGRIRNYTLSYIGTKENNPTKEMSQTLDAAQLSYEFTNLIAGYSYTFGVLATTVKPGSSREIIHFFPILEPSIAREYIDNRDAMKPKKTGPEPSETEFVVELVNPFTDKNGKIKSYSVIVATSNQDLAKDTTLLKWSKAQEGAFESPYIAINECPDLFEAESKCHKVVTARRKREAGPTIEITIGGDQSCVPETTAYCNGKLSPNTNYYVLLRAYTETGLHADTPFSAPILTAPKDQTILIAVVCAVVAALIFIIVIVLVVILVRRKKRRSDDDPGTGMGPVSHKSSFKEPEITSIPVKIDKFDEHVTHMSADSDFRFAEEYEDLKQVGRDQSWSISELPVNRPKNRFTNILPYDHSRVKLLPTDDEEGSDYINANWMPGYNSKREFIVTQGALPATTDDFWRMMWEQNSRAIVMLTKCVERGREKCHHYWPVDSEPIFYGDLQVTVLNETKDPEWVITEFKLAKGEISRKVLHFHYTAWPDFDVPEKPQSLINFVRIVRGRVGIHGGPITVHCSAGVGRSGTYICIDRLLQVIQNTDVVDIYGIVYEMRRERCFMVQTERQYICIHQCLLCVIKGEDEDPENVYENGQVNPGFEDDGIVMD